MNGLFCVVECGTTSWTEQGSEEVEADGKAEDSDRIIRLSPSDYPAPKRSPGTLSHSVQRTEGGADDAGATRGVGPIFTDSMELVRGFVREAMNTMNTMNTNGESG